MVGGYLNITTNTTGTIGGVGSDLALRTVIVGTAGATNSLVLRQGSASGTIIATLDTNTVRQFDFWGLRCPGGLFYNVSGGTPANITIVYD